MCRQLGVPPRESLGETITCEAYRRLTKCDLFYKGQYLFHLQCKYNRTDYRMMFKEYGKTEWKEWDREPRLEQHDECVE